MTSHPTTRACRDNARMLSPYLDGELGAAKLLEIDEHVAGCATCREEVQLLRAMRGSLKRVVRPAAAPSGLRDRIGNAMAAERTRRDVTVEQALGDLADGPPQGWSSWRTMVPLATAAALALIWGATTRGSVSPGTSVNASMAHVGDELLDELVAEHSQPLPPEVVNAKEVRELQRFVGVPVYPAGFERGGAHLVGGRVVPLRSQRAAMLQFVVGSGDNARRLSVIVYDAQKIEVGTANFAPRAVGTAEVRVGREKGYSVAATQRGGIGYLLASDLDTDKNAQLAAMVYDDR